MPIDWSRIPEPQADGYDTLVITLAAVQRYGLVPKALPLAHWLDGWVRIGPASPEQVQRTGYPPAPGDHPTLARGAELLGTWPVMYRQCQALLVSVQPILVPEIGDGPRQGCICGPLGDREFGEIYVSVFDPIGFVEGVVHELAHWKLHALGVHLESWDDSLIANTPDELYASPIRKDKLRPMGAVLQAQYSYLHVLDLDLHLRDLVGEAAAPYIAVTATRMAEGQATLQASFRGTEAGQAFMEGLDAWTVRLLAEALR